jgi:hypothetical protein
MKHNYIPLVKYRGWSEEKNEWVYGYYRKIYFHNQSGAILEHSIISRGEVYTAWDDYDAPREKWEVHPDSIGIYTGKDDCEDTPIFCAVNGAKRGSDIVEVCGAKVFDIVFNNGGFECKNNNVIFPLSIAVQNSNVHECYLKVISNQWESSND